MTARDALVGRWQTSVVLKRDVFSTVERGIFRGESGEIPAVLRRLDEVPWWSWPLARRLFDRERRALASATDIALVAARTAKPVVDVAATYFAAAAFFRLDRKSVV